MFCRFITIKSIEQMIKLIPPQKTSEANIQVMITKIPYKSQSVDLRNPNRIELKGGIRIHSPFPQQNKIQESRDTYQESRTIDETTTTDFAVKMENETERPNFSPFLPTNSTYIASDICDQHQHQAQQYFQQIRSPSKTQLGNDSAFIRRQRSTSYKKQPQKWQSKRPRATHSSYQPYISSNPEKKISLSCEQRRVIELKERLKNLHNFYQSQIKGQKMKNIEKNQHIMAIFEDMQELQTQRVKKLKSRIAEAKRQRNQIEKDGERMIAPNRQIKKILEESLILKKENKPFEDQKRLTAESLNKKQKKALALRKQLDSQRKVIHKNASERFKEGKRNRDMLEMIGRILEDQLASGNF